MLTARGRVTSEQSGRSGQARRAPAAGHAGPNGTFLERRTGGDDDGQQRAPVVTDLSLTAALAARSFDTWEQAADAVLDIVMGLLGMRSVFLTRMDMTVEPHCQRVVAARNAPGEFAIRVGQETPLQDTI